MDLNWKLFDHKLKYPFGISRHTYTSQPGIFIFLSDGNHTGYGELTINPYYNTEIQELEQQLSRFKKRLSALNYAHPDILFEILHESERDNLFIEAAINNACWDIEGKQKGKSVRELLGIKINSVCMSSYTIGVDSIETMLQKMKSLPWPVYKIKLGTENDLEIIKELRKHTDAIFRIDANSAWEADSAIRLSEDLDKLGVEFIEQPLPADDVEGMKEVYKHSRLPLIADESCVREEDVDACRDLFHGVNIKLLKCGGISPALRMHRRALELGMKTMIGCMLESSCGISAATALLPLFDYADLDGPMLIENDPFNGLLFANGKVMISGKPGLGIRPGG